MTAAACNIPVDAAISESGLGQFEVNLNHVSDALKADDDAVYFKSIIKSCARKHGMSASFMAKPYLEHAGNGLHVHFSVLDRDGKNVFNDGTEDGSRMMTSAVAGLIDTMAEMTLIFAPHMNSYRRFSPASLAPTKPVWGYENRTAAVRIPGGPAVARRIEHRVAGADANPYLVVAAIFGAAAIGIQGELTPPAALKGNAYDAEVEPLPTSWIGALNAFEKGARGKKIFDPVLRSMFVACKRQEQKRFAEHFSDFEYQTYLDSV